jgi:hypothetical protein
MLELSDHSRRAAARNFGENGHFCYMQCVESEWCGGEGTEPQEGFYRASTGLQQGFNNHSRRAGGRFAARPFWPFCAFCVGKLNK